jgi:hypothetical protein
MRRWQAAHQRVVPELPLRWMLPIRGNERRLSLALKDYLQLDRGSRRCLGLFAAAGELGFGFVHAAPPSLYLENLDPNLLARFGLSPEGAEHAPDVLVRVPTARESVFRAAVLRDGVPVADILQVWLDVAAHPARGAAQAKEIRHRALSLIFNERA